ncbi:MAG: EamA family transporter [Bdellovibrionales bacterium]|nr:EamA family transporter [Bdellovibrionales bacterium]
MSALLGMNIAVLIWGFTGILGRSIHVNEISLVFWRLFITVVSLGLGASLFKAMLQSRYPVLFKTRTGKYPMPKVLSRQALILIIPGMTLGIHWIFFYGSIKYANISVALTCLGSAPLLAAIIEPLFFKRRIKNSEIVLGLVVLLGITIIYYSHLQFSKGVIYGALASVLTVLVSVLNKNIVAKYSPVQMIGVQMSGALLAVCLFFPLYASTFHTPFEFPSLQDTFYLFILSWACTIFTFFLWILALQEVSAFTTNILLTLEPVYGIVLAFIFYKEHLEMRPHFYVGFFFIGAAVLIHTLGPKLQKMNEPN